LGADCATIGHKVWRQVQNYVTLQRPKEMTVERYAIINQAMGA